MVDVSDSTPSQLTIGDPDNIPVRVVNGVPHFGVIGSLIALTLTTARVSFVDGKLEPDLVIAARLRFDLEIAKLLRDNLDSQIRLLTVATDAKAN